MSELRDQIERSLLGSLFRWPAIIDEVATIVGPADMRSDKAQKVLTAILHVRERGPVDLVTVADELKRRGWIDDTGYALLADLWDCEPTGAHAVQYARAIKGRSLSDGLRRVANQLLGELDAPSRDPIDTLDDYSGRLIELATTSCEAGNTEIIPEVNASLDRIDARMAGQVASGLDTGYPDLDDLLSFRDGELTILASRPSVGKTALGINLAWHLAGHRRLPTLVVSLEMSRAELVETRLIPLVSRVNSHQIRHGRLSKQDQTAIGEAASRLRSVPLYIDDTPTVTPIQLAARVRQQKRSRKLKIVMVDYLQLISPSDRKQSRHEQVGEISRRLKLLARETQLPVIALAQVNRDADGRAPKLSDLRESGSIEQDADNVLLLHREHNGSDLEPEARLLVGKQRNGPTGAVSLVFLGETGRFESAACGGGL